MDAYSPQRILDQIYSADVPGLFEAGMTASQQKEAIADTKEKLKLVYKRLNQAQKDIRARYQEHGDEASEPMKIALAPYTLLGGLLKELETQIIGLESAIADGKMHPEGFDFDRYIFGDEATGEWFMGDSEDADLWDYGLKVKSELAAFMDQRRPIHARLKAMQDETKNLKSDIIKAADTLKKQNQRSAILRRLLVVLVIGIVFVAVGAFLLLSENVLPGAGALAIGALLVLYTPIGYRRWKNRMETLSVNIEEWKSKYRQNNVDMKKLRGDYIPLNERCKELKEEYESVRKGFST